MRFVRSFVECFRLRPEDCTAISFYFFTFSDRVYTSKALKNICIVQKFLKSVDFDNQFRFNMGLINKVDMVCLSPVGYGV